MARRKKQVWCIGNLFLLPLADGEACLGQVVGIERELLNSAAVALFDRKGPWDEVSDLPRISCDDVFSVIYVTKDLLDSGRWRIVADRALSLPHGAVPYEHLRDGGFVGASVRGSALVEDFANAFYGLAPWDDWYVPDYLDGYLLSPEMKPLARLVYSGRHPVPADLGGTSKAMREPPADQ